MKINLPLEPFRVNKAWRGGRRFKTKEYIKWLEDGCWLLKGYQKSLGELEVHLRCYMRNYSRSDVDGPVKPILDLMTLAGLIEDDRFIKKLIVEKFKSDEERIEIEISDMASTETGV